MYPCLSDTPEGVVIQVQVLPRSSRTGVVALQGDALKIKLTSPPVDGAANKTCRDYLAKLFGVGKGQVSIISGETSRKKRILITGAAINDVVAVLQPLLG